ncbi:MAG: hypothetical protein A2Y12_01680 [Planctomycetes bacterium GWF2_42_9]|nr:MAG: hypothetical protein A2Y12_01680 [Planctomycetes bacterium GWF2_42_9]HAL45677.1 hypothetical protein [Phycisphaerales bacterium]
MTEAQKQAMKKYMQSSKGRAARRRANLKYEITGKAKNRRRRYANSSKGVESKMRSVANKKFYI